MKTSMLMWARKTVISQKNISEFLYSCWKNVKCACCLCHEHRWITHVLPWLSCDEIFKDSKSLTSAQIREAYSLLIINHLKSNIVHLIVIGIFKKVQLVPRAFIVPVSKLLIVLKSHIEVNPAFPHLKGTTALFPPRSPSAFFTVDPRFICICGQEVTDSAAQSDILILRRQLECAPVHS